MAVHAQALSAAQRQVIDEGVHFYGEVRNRLNFEDTVMAQVVHSQDRTLPVHEHAMPYFALIVSGNYEEEGKYGFEHFGAFTAVFNPLPTRHTGIIRRGGVTFFTAEIGPRWMDPFERTALDNKVTDMHGGKLAWLAVRLFREHAEAGTACELTMESLVWEMLALTARLRDSEAKERPDWWNRVRERLHDGFSDNLRIGELAQEAGVHPVYLARTFRKITGSTPGEYLQGLRLQYVCRELLNKGKPLAQIAAEAGFADQSHMTRTLKRRTGETPGDFSKLLGNCKEPAVAQ
jgi:AraC family transcriptional regulator